MMKTTPCAASAPKSSVTVLPIFVKLVTISGFTSLVLLCLASYEIIICTHITITPEICDCRLCETQLLGLTYGCFDCGFFLHKRCLELMAEELQHPCHSHHPVFVEHDSGMFICEKCRDLCRGFMASCKDCDLKIDFKCAFLVDTSNGVIQRSTFDGVKTQIRHFGDEFHLLSFFNCKEGMELVCNGCRLPLSGPTYGCFECAFYLHKSCAELPKEIRHPYHPIHKLYLKFSRRKPCEACGIRPWGKYSRLAYQCYECYHFLLDSLCAVNSLGVISALRNKDYHPEDLYYFVAPDHLVGYSFPCKICGQNCDGSFFNWIGFKAYFHIDCIGIPREIKHDCHMHALTLTNPTMEKETDESLSTMYYCFACEEPRNPKYHFYDCQQCASTDHIFTAHIECVLSNEVVEIEPDRMIKGNGEDGDGNYPTLSTLSVNPKCIRQLEIGDARNDHVLCYSEQGFFDFSFSIYIE
ncbi:hypothetical protein K2173_017778 [Erythroxylum novogranatense]|uniref:TNFR-Cys domain-containing protein n=1 Tax=Erythroxylum novogranatense TaxID=1862640 RepID=A0AAV8T370_9ROSI|nr:hypothetical protein K2173_017778 [Erythroxylum novogranatense]